MLHDAPAGGGSDAAMGSCNPLTQAGCNANEKCTWVNDQANPPIGHVGCVPDGTIALGGACTDPPGGAGAMGYDTCVKGTVCLSGECKAICDVQGGAPMCDTNHSCTRYADFFEVGGNAVAGVCDPSCDPLTQALKAGTNTAACGSTNPAMPNKGCFGFDDYSCAPTGMNNWGLTDRKMPQTNSAGQAYLNGCAPGFLPFFFDMTGSMTTLCSGYCAALESDNAKPAANAKGDATALAKLPTDAAPAAGNATCAIGKKGSEASSVCKFIWPYLEDNSGMLLPSFENGPYLDTLGVCFAIAHFTYTDAAMMTQPYPDCKNLPPPSGATTGMFDDAADWLCYKKANTPAFTGSAHQHNPAVKDAWIGKRSELAMQRHILN